jgi:hypothetical protein
MRRTCVFDDGATLLLLFAFFSIQDDLAIMIEGVDGRYYLQAGAVLIPGLFLPFSFPPFSPGFLLLLSSYLICEYRLMAP